MSLKPATEPLSPPTKAAPTQISAEGADSHALGAYAAPSLHRLDLSPECWDRERDENRMPRWADTPEGRVKIRLISRGVLGAAAYTWAGYFAAARMRDYNPEGPVKNWVQGIARFYDIAAGKPIEAAVNLLGHDGKKFITCSPTVKFAGYSGPGCSLGHKVVNVTFDFAAMSIGDFWGRTIAKALDPNNELDWIKDDGSVDYTKAAKAFAKNWWTAITYSAGEDWAVGVPYVLTMEKLGTPAINRLFPGYRYDFDNNGAGGGILVNNHGRPIGNFTLPGVINLWERFTTYNIGTLMFREVYNGVARRITQWRHGEAIDPLLEPDSMHPNRTLGETFMAGASQLGTWGARDAVKASIYMLPAVPFFWVTRVPQHKYRGYFIHPEKGMLRYGEEGAALRVTSPFIDPHFNHMTPVYFEKTGERALNPFGPHGFDPHAVSYNIVDAALTPMGRLNDQIREWFKPAGAWLQRHADTVRKYTGIEMDVTPLGRKKLPDGIGITNTYVNAALAYTPYFAAKSDVFGYAVDDGRTDLAIERMNKGAFTLNPGEFFAGANEIYHSVAHHELPDPAREAMAEKRLLGHSSPSDLSRDEAKDAPVSEKINPAIRRARRAALFTERTQPRALMTPTAQPYAMAAMTAPRPNERFVDFLHRINEQPASEPHYSLAP